MAKKRRGPKGAGWNLNRLAYFAAGALVLVAGVFLVVRSAANSSPPVTGNDFRIVAYQGDDALGGHESSISRVVGQGKPVVLNFFAGQCPPCRAEMPGFQRVADEYQGKVVFVGVDIGPYLDLGSHDDARALLAELKMRYPAAYAVDSRPLKVYGVKGMPTTIIFDSAGQVVETHTGIYTEAQLRDRLRALVAA
ncbi:MAG TPA: TlpA disulfide reductase family protein [Candidatus Acidoferrales bacterium]|nr:TlpA disulfide reductase family protein [Candidatus Acidoferrales bacterium]